MRPGTSAGRPGPTLGPGVALGPGLPLGPGVGVGPDPAPPTRRWSASARVGPQTTVVGEATTIRWNSGNFEDVDWRYTGWRYISVFHTGATIRLPRPTLLPCWSQSVIWAEMVGS